MQHLLKKFNKFLRTCKGIRKYTLYILFNSVTNRIAAKNLYLISKNQFPRINSQVPNPNIRPKLLTNIYANSIYIPIDFIKNNAFVGVPLVPRPLFLGPCSSALVPRPLFLGPCSNFYFEKFEHLWKQQSK